MQTCNPHVARNHVLDIPKEFRMRVEIPLQESFLDWMIMGTICGGFIAFIANASAPLLSIVVAVISYGSVGLTAGWLVFGLYDIIANGRLEFEAELPADESSQIRFYKDADFVEPSSAELVLPKAS